MPQASYVPPAYSQPAAAYPVIMDPPVPRMPTNGSRSVGRGGRCGMLQFSFPCFNARQPCCMPFLKYEPLLVMPFCETSLKQEPLCVVPSLETGYGGAAADPYAAAAAAQFGAAAPAAAAAPAMPSVWQALQDDQGRTYYYNSQTGQSQWEKPAEMP
eukprot:scaffold80587_cov18-Tisochrysis_lutea.AAC.3